MRVRLPFLIARAARDVAIPSADLLRILSLCSGAGGLELGVHLATGARAAGVCYVERDAYSAAILASAMERGALRAAPIWSDVRSFDGKPWRGVVDCITAGYPCQPFSVAGNRQGFDDERNVWPDIVRVVNEVEPAICFFENVRGHVRNGLREVRADLRRMGFFVRAGLFSAAEVGAPHRRVRLFILAAHPDRRPLRFIAERNERDETKRRDTVTRDAGKSGIAADAVRSSVADADGGRREAVGVKNERDEQCARRDITDRCVSANPWRRDKPHPEPTIHRVDDGVAHWMDRLRATGNGVVPQQAARAWGVLWQELLALHGERIRETDDGSNAH